MKKLSSLYLMIGLLVAATAAGFAGGKTDKDKPKKDPYVFTPVVELKATPVKNQGGTGTCWSFATTSFVESELIRMGREEVSLAPMINARFAYPRKAASYVRYSGMANFGPGGQAHDVMRAIREFGFVPEDVYTAMRIGEERHNHGELDSVLRGMLDAVVAKRGRKITPVWPRAVEAVLDVYLGPLPGAFEYKGKTYTPKSFAAAMGFNPDDYVEFTSFTHHPFYAKFDLEVPDNWSRDLYYNVPVDDLVKIMDYALDNGYTVAWDGDVSEKTFGGAKLCVSTIPADDDFDPESEKGKEALDAGPIKEKEVTQDMRQATFDNQTSTDDHLMHITGVAKDQTGARFYHTKNSWGTKDMKFGGYWYMSVPYVRLKTIAILVPKAAVPAAIRAKLS